MSDGSARQHRKRLICDDMTSQQTERQTKAFDLGEFRVDPRRRIIAGPSGETMIEPKVMAVLLMLVERPGEVISRQEFVDTIWTREYGGDESLTRAVSHLRKVFRETRGPQTHIETVPKTGYRLIDQHRPAESGAKQGKRRRLIAAGVAVVLAAMIASVLIVQRNGVGPPDQAAAGTASVVLAVLPFDSQSNVVEDLPLALGLADEILSALSQSPSISVIAGNSSFRFQGDDKKNLEVLAQALNVSHVVDGSVRRSPEGLRVGVHLIDTGTALVVWSDVVTRSDLEIYTIPKVVAAAVQTALGIDPVEAWPGTAPPDPVAYEAYLQTKALLRLPWNVNLTSAIEGLEAIVEMDPGFSQAWATLALARLDILFTQAPDDKELPNIDPPRRLQAARHEARAALALDPGSIDALLALEIIDYREHATTLAETVGRIRSLLARAPNHPKVNFRMGLMMNQVGRFNEAARYMGKEVELDPLAVLPPAFYHDALISSGRTGEARAFMKQRNTYQFYRLSYAWLTMRLLEKDFQSAREFFTDLEPNVLFWHDGLAAMESIDVKSPNTTRMSLLLARLVTVAEQGDASLDSTIAADLVQAADEGLILHFYLFQWLAAAGLNDAAFDLARDRIALGDTFFRESGVLLKPAFTAARRDPRVMELFDATRQLDYWLETGNWPDYCAHPELPYDCEEAAQRYILSEPRDHGIGDDHQAGGAPANR